MTWKYAEAQAKFQEWVESAQKEPQILSIDGEEVAVLISKSDFEKMKPKKHILDALAELPLQGVDLSRSNGEAREIDF